MRDFFSQNTPCKPQKKDTLDHFSPSYFLQDVSPPPCLRKWFIASSVLSATSTKRPAVWRRPSSWPPNRAMATRCWRCWRRRHRSMQRTSDRSRPCMWRHRMESCSVAGFLGGVWGTWSDYLVSFFWWFWSFGFTQRPFRDFCCTQKSTCSIRSSCRGICFGAKQWK